MKLMELSGTKREYHKEKINKSETNNKNKKERLI
jgi:hypothetical protein